MKSNRHSSVDSCGRPPRDGNVRSGASHDGGIDDSLSLFAALSDVRDDFILESELPETGHAAGRKRGRRAVARRAERAMARASRDAERDQTLGSVSAGTRWAAGICGVVAVGTLLTLMQINHRLSTPPTNGPLGSERETIEETRSDAEALSFVFVSHGDGTCSVKASETLRQYGLADGTLCIPAQSPAGDVVTAISEYGFIWLDDVRTVVIPDTVTTIGAWAFAECASMQTVEFSQSRSSELRTIEMAAFVNCTSLETVILPPKLIDMGDSAFSSCTSLEEVTLPSSLASLPKWAFYGCTSLQTVHMTEGLRSVGYCAFYGCTDLNAPVFPSTLETVDSGAFAECTSFVWLTLPDSVRTIGARAFANCRFLRFLTLPASPESISEDAFDGCTPVAVRRGGDGEWTVFDGFDFDLEIREESETGS